MLDANYVRDGLISGINHNDAEILERTVSLTFGFELLDKTFCVYKVGSLYDVKIRSASEFWFRSKILHKYGFWLNQAIISRPCNDKLIFYVISSCLRPEISPGIFPHKFESWQYLYLHSDKRLEEGYNYCMEWSKNNGVFKSLEKYKDCATYMNYESIQWEIASGVYRGWLKKEADYIC